MSINWNSENLRLSIFLTPNSVPNTNTWWKEVVGAEPDTISQQPKNGLIQYIGLFNENTQLTLTIRPERIDWLLTISEVQSRSIELPIIDLRINIFNVIAPKLNSWLESSCPPCVRLAWGEVLLEKVNGKNEAYTKLQPYLPSVKLDIENSSEFNYSINRPKSFNNINYNRISRWSVIKLCQLNINVVNEQLSRRTNETFACRLEIDISTNANTLKELPNNKIPEIFSKLTTLAKEISDDGDI